MVIGLSPTMVMIGSVVSTTCMVLVAVVEFPVGSTAVYIMLWFHRVEVFTIPVLLTLQLSASVQVAHRSV